MAFVGGNRGISRFSTLGQVSPYYGGPISEYYQPMMSVAEAWQSGLPLPEQRVKQRQLTPEEAWGDDMDNILPAPPSSDTWLFSGHDTLGEYEEIPQIQQEEDMAYGNLGFDVSSLLAPIEQGFQAWTGLQTAQAAQKTAQAQAAAAAAQAAAVAAAQKAGAIAKPGAAGGTNWLLYGGIAAVGGLALFLILRKRK